MSNKIIIDDKTRKNLIDEFNKALMSGDLIDSNGKITFSKVFKSDDKAKVWYTTIAWSKMVLILKHFNKEVAWHGVVERTDKPNEFIITDIMVYPQEVTGSTVNTDQSKYQMWLMDDDKDEIFNKIRMQGHSHVNMGTSPSSVDTTQQSQILELLKTQTDSFYIFQIWNKKLECWSKIYDLKNNIMYETSDVEVDIIDEEFGDFIKEAKSLVVEKTYTSKANENKTKSYPSYPYDYGYNSGYYYGSPHAKQTSDKTNKSDNNKKTNNKGETKEGFALKVKERYNKIWDKGSKK